MTDLKALARIRRAIAVAELTRRQNNIFIERRYERPASLIR